MQTDSPTALSGRLRGPQTVTGGSRGKPATVTMRRTTAIAPLIEAQALCADVLSATERIQVAAASGSREAIVNEAGRLGYRATQARAEFHRMAGELEK